MDSSTLEARLNQLSKQNIKSANFPLFFDTRKIADRNKLHDLLEKSQILFVKDNTHADLEDLFRIDFPYIAQGTYEYKNTLKRYRKNNLQKEEMCNWAYYPWKYTLVRTLPENLFYKIRTSRNKFLIAEEEQNVLSRSKISIAGLSVGASILNSLVLSSIGKSFKLADPDILSTTNLNRILATVYDSGENKTAIAAKKSYEMNPFLKIHCFQEGLTEKNYKKFFFFGEEKTQIFIEETDNIKLKITSRQWARKLRIPVLMATDNGDNTIIDIERFDIEPNRPIFHGAVDEQKLANISSNLDLVDKVKLANKIVGSDVTSRMQNSLQLVGLKIPAWPQLGNAATLSGCAASYAIRRILLKEKMPSGRYRVDLDSNLDTTYFYSKNIKNRKLGTEKFIENFNIIFGNE